MKSFDIAISYHEGSLVIFNVAVPTKILEYLACGLCIVTTDQTMYRNLLTHEIDGYLTGQDSESFAEGIIKILKDRPLAVKMSNNALITAQNLSLRKVAENVEISYQRSLDFSE